MYRWLWLELVGALLVRSLCEESETETTTRSTANHRINGFSHFKFEAHTGHYHWDRSAREIFV